MHELTEAFAGESIDSSCNVILFWLSPHIASRELRSHITWHSISGCKDLDDNLMNREIKTDNNINTEREQSRIQKIPKQSRSSRQILETNMVQSARQK